MTGVFYNDSALINNGARAAQKGFRRGSSRRFFLRLDRAGKKSSKHCEIERTLCLNQVTERFRRVRACNG